VHGLLDGFRHSAFDASAAKLAADHTGYSDFGDAKALGDLHLAYAFQHECRSDLARVHVLTS